MLFQQGVRRWQMTRGLGTVFVIDDDPAVLLGLDVLLRSVGLTCQTFSDATTFLEALVAETPGCVVADVRLPDLSGLELQEELVRRKVTLPVILISGNADVPMAVRGMRAGALDFLEKPFSSQQLLERVEHALRKCQSGFAERERRTDARRRLSLLTPREAEVVAMVTAGRANKEMARLLGISQKTVELHRSRAMHKLGAHHVADLVALTLQSRELS